MSGKGLFWICFSIIVFAIISYSSLVWCIIEDNKDLKETKEKLSHEQTLSTTCEYKRDSLINEVKLLSTYETLSKAMANRDESIKLLTHKVGDVVIMKNDSARGVIEDVLIGGGKYNYYVKLRVLLQDNTTKEIVPELIY